MEFFYNSYFYINCPSNLLLQKYKLSTAKKKNMTVVCEGITFTSYEVYGETTRMCL